MFPKHTFIRVEILFWLTERIVSTNGGFEELAAWGMQNRKPGGVVMGACAVCLRTFSR